MTISPHPVGETGEGAGRNPRTGKAPHEGVINRSIRPICLCGNDSKTVSCDEYLGDPRPRVVELGGAVCGFAEKHHAPVSEALRKRGQFGKVAKPLRGAGDYMAEARA